MCIIEELEEMKKVEKILNKPILPNEIWNMIDEIRRIEFQKRIYNFEVEHGGILRYRFVLNLRLHLGRYIHSCYSIINRIDIKDFNRNDLIDLEDVTIPPDTESEDELDEEYPWDEYI